MSKVLGIDYGTKRIGIAISNHNQTIAFTREKIDAQMSEEKVIEAINQLCIEDECEKIIIGLPINQKGSETTTSLSIRKFAQKLENVINIPVILWDERFTTKTAEQILITGNVKRKDRKQKIDSLSAQIMLQHYLDAMKP